MNISVGGSVESSHLIVEEPDVMDGEENGGGCGHGSCLGEDESDSGGFLVVADFFSFDRCRVGIAIFSDEGGRNEAELLGVHDDFSAVLLQVGGS